MSTASTCRLRNPFLSLSRSSLLRPAPRITCQSPRPLSTSIRKMSDNAAYKLNESGGVDYKESKGGDQVRPQLPPDVGGRDGGITAGEVDDYLHDKLGLSSYFEEDLLAEAGQKAKEAGIPDIAVSAMQGQFLHILCKSIGASRVLEIGTLWGYSTSFMASAVPSHGQIDTIEFSPLHAQHANSTFLSLDLYPFPKVHVGPALEILQDPEGPFKSPPGVLEGMRDEEQGYDFVFIDANKDQIHEYFQEAIRLTRKGGVIVVDNAIRGGRIAREENDNPVIDVVGLRKMYDWVKQDGGKTVIMSGIQTVGAKSWDGFAIAYKQ